MGASDHGKQFGSREGAKKRQRYVRLLEGMNENGVLPRASMIAAAW